MTADHDFDRQLSSWFDQIATPGVPAGLLERSLERIGATRQRAGWLVRDRGRSPGAMGRPVAAPAWAGRLLAVTASVVLVVVGGGLFLKLAPALISGPTDAPSVMPPPSIAPSASVAPSPSPAPTPTTGPGALIAYIRTTDKPDNTNCLGYDPPPNCPTLRLWVVGSDGSGAHELFPDGFGWQSLFGWSPDGTRLLYGDEVGLYLTDLSGGAPQPVDMGCVEPCRSDGSPAFSNDGAHLVFLRSSADAEGYDGPADIATMDLASGRVTELASTAEAAGMPGWSPDGTQIVFSTFGDKDMGITGPIAPRHAALFIVDVDGQNLRQISPPTLDTQFAGWSPDGSRIVFMSPATNGGDIYTIRPDGTDLRRLTSDGISTDATWAPDGRILFVRDSGFWTMDADGANAAELVPGSVLGAEPTDFQYSRPLWQPTGGAAIVPPPWHAQAGTLIGPPPPTPAPTPPPALAQGFSWTGSTNPTETDATVDTVTLLTDGRVLVTRICDPAAELYDPLNGTFTPAGSMTATRGGQTATRLLDGRVLISGGSNCGNADDSGIWSSAELYDPATGTFTPTGSMGTPRTSHRATLLLDGRVLITGGQTGAVPPGAVSIVAVVLASYQGGRLAASSADVLATAELYDPATGTFSPTGSMRDFRDRHSATLLQDGRILVLGGGGEGYDARTSAELYDPTTGTFSPTGSMQHARWLNTATLLNDGRVLIAGGRSAKGTTYASAEVYDSGSGKFTPAGSMDASRQQHTATLLQDGRVLITGGYQQDASHWDLLSATELYDPATGTFAPIGSMGDARDGHTATLLNDGRVLLVGGSGIGIDGIVPLTSAVLYQP